MQNLKLPSRATWESLTPRQRIAEHMAVLTLRSTTAQRLRAMGHPPERLERDEITFIAWEAMTPGEQYGAHLDLIIDVNNLAGFLQEQITPAKVSSCQEPQATTKLSCSVMSRWAVARW